jgi:hypothetical protein
MVENSAFGYNGVTFFSSLLKRSEYADWEKKNYSSGSTPDCENITPEYDNELENYLQIQVGNNTDVVVKMMRKSIYGDRCIRGRFM